MSRRKERIKRAANIDVVRRGFVPTTYALMTMVTTIVMVLSWGGLVRFGHTILGLSGWMAYIVPGSLDGVVLMFAGIAVVSTSEGENSAIPRMVVNLYAVFSAVFNGYQGWKDAANPSERYFSGGYYAALSLTVAVAFHWFLRRIQRAVRVDDGKLNDEVVYFALREWMRFPIRRWKARTLALEYGISDPKLAVELEAAKNRRIDSRVMLALESYRNETGTPVYEFFTEQDKIPVTGNGTGKRQKTSEVSTGIQPESLTVRTSIGMPELTTGTVTGSAGMTELTTGTTIEVTHDRDSAVPAGTSRPERPEPEPEVLEIPGQTGCVGFDQQCGCRHRNAVTFFRNQREAVEYARNETGNETGTDLVRWLSNHGRKVGQSTAYDVLKSSTGKGKIVQFRSPESSEA